MALITIIQFVLLLITLFLIAFFVIYLLKIFLRIMGIKMEQEPDFFGLLIGPSWNRFFYTNTFNKIKNNDLRKALNIILSALINLIAVLLSLFVVFCLIYLISYINHK